MPFLRNVHNCGALAGLPLRVKMRAAHKPTGVHGISVLYAQVRLSLSLGFNVHILQTYEVSNSVVVSKCCTLYSCKWYLLFMFVSWCDLRVSRLS